MKQPPETDIAVNTMRARLTVLGFNLAIITFQIGLVLDADMKGADGVTSPFYGFSLGLALLLGALVTIVSLVVFIASARLNREGTCDVHLVIAGDLLMYLSLLMTLFVFIDPYQAELDQIALRLSHDDLEMIHGIIRNFGSLAWLGAGYLAPGLLLLRTNIAIWRRIVAFVLYNSALFALTWLILLAGSLERGVPSPSLRDVLVSALMGPLNW